VIKSEFISKWCLRPIRNEKTEDAKEAVGQRQEKKSATIGSSEKRYAEHRIDQTPRTVLLLLCLFQPELLMK
jgi:hypothetical protein